MVSPIGPYISLPVEIAPANDRKRKRKENTKDPASTSVPDHAKKPYEKELPLWLWGPLAPKGIKHLLRHCTEFHEDQEQAIINELKRT